MTLRAVCRGHDHHNQVSRPHCHGVGAAVTDFSLTVARAPRCETISDAPDANPTGSMAATNTGLALRRSGRLSGLPAAQGDAYVSRESERLYADMGSSGGTGGCLWKRRLFGYDRAPRHTLMLCRARPRLTFYHVGRRAAHAMASIPAGRFVAPETTQLGCRGLGVPHRRRIRNVRQAEDAAEPFSAFRAGPTVPLCSVMLTHLKYAKRGTASSTSVPISARTASRSAFPKAEH